MLAVLPAAHRMRRSADFSSTVRSGVRTGRPRLVVHLLPSSDPERRDGATVGFVVSKAVGGAVERNRVKRRLRSLVASRLHLLPDGARLVVRALPAAVDATSVDLGRDLDAALARATTRLAARAPMPPGSPR